MRQATCCLVAGLLAWLTLAACGGPLHRGAGFKMLDPKLMRVGEVMLLGEGSPAVDAAVAGTFPFLMDDIQGQPRAQPDVGADERSMAQALRDVLTVAQVGPDAP